MKVKKGDIIRHNLGGIATVDRVDVDGMVHFSNGGFSGCHHVSLIKEIIAPPTGA